ncbi:MAG: hypothetical protein ACI8TE_001282 [Francisella sp.]|jgi:hypothetical protein
MTNTIKNKILNIFDSLDIIGITFILTMAFYYQLFLHERHIKWIYGNDTDITAYSSQYR